MARYLLTNPDVRNAKPKEKPYRLKDGDGLFLYVPPSGVQSWQFRYKINGKRQTLMLGKASVMGLAEARRRADEARSAAADGKHLTTLKRVERAKTAADQSATFESVAESEVAALRSDTKLRALAVTSANRGKMPDVPTRRELDFPSIDPTLWHGYAAPAGTPPDVVAKLASVITRAVQDQEFQDVLKPMGFQEDLKMGDALAKFINSEQARAKEIIVENNIRISD